ncbi:hypothetical protein LXA43DRAFT_893083 [Ganoderma leucocontextum]|nr:hypothetical protein LXA43DRAFT_893083 [Ganoderma leucocontextum]
MTNNNSAVRTGSPPPNWSSGIVLDESGWPDWLKQTFNWMEGRQSSLGPDFMSAAEWWTVIERAYSWETSTKGYNTKNCLEQVGHWLRVLRAEVARVPAIADTAQYAEQWWDWWSSLQPDWCKHDKAGHPTAGGTGPWNTLKKPRKNELWIVLLALVWWGLQVTDMKNDYYNEMAHNEWTSAAKDVVWVSTQMATWALNEWCVHPPIILWWDTNVQPS